MRLSEAIRLGATLSPQGFGKMFSKDGSNATCALGAALAATGELRFVDWTEEYNTLSLRWPWLRKEAARCPASTRIDVADVASIIYVIQVLNDTHRWTREAIADWVATVEPEPPVEMTIEAIEPEVAVAA